MANKIPIFDFGDTLVPCFRLQNQLMKDEFDEHGEEVPEFDVNNFRIYTPSEVKEYLELNGLEHADPLRLIEKYKERERKFMEQNAVFELLKKCSAEFGKTAIISDNTIEGREWLEQQLKAQKVPFEGLVVSEEVGAEKPDPEIFKEFLRRREEPAERFVYFGNNLNRDPACEKVGIDFVFVDRYHSFGQDSGHHAKIDRLDLDSVRRAVR
ncbi:MAG: HAD family hydrolase [Candidatus Nanohaloarchaea archaeon]